MKENGPGCQQQSKMDNLYSKEELDAPLLEELTEASFMLFPNPSHNYVHLSIPAFKHPIELKVYDVAGHLTQTFSVESSEMDINTSDWVGGTYTLTFSLSNKTIHKKLVVIK